MWTIMDADWRRISPRRSPHITMILAMNIDSDCSSNSGFRALGVQTSVYRKEGEKRENEPLSFHCTGSAETRDPNTRVGIRLLKKRSVFIEDRQVKGSKSVIQE